MDARPAPQGTCAGYGLQHPLQMLLILRSSLRSALSVTAFPVAVAPPRRPPDGAMVPTELVRGAAALFPGVPTDARSGRSRPPAVWPKASVPNSDSMRVQKSRADFTAGLSRKGADRMFGYVRQRLYPSHVPSYPRLRHTLNHSYM